MGSQTNSPYSIPQVIFRYSIVLQCLTSGRGSCDIGGLGQCPILGVFQCSANPPEGQPAAVEVKFRVGFGRGPRGSFGCNVKWPILNSSLFYSTVLQYSTVLYCKVRCIAKYGILQFGSILEIRISVDLQYCTVYYCTVSTVLYCTVQYCFLNKPSHQLGR